jgi:BASS family bile acid:Na+ symporter
MGMTLSIDDFKRVAKSPFHIAVGLFVQLIIAPLLAYIIAIILQLNSFEAVGLVVLAACPGGAVSNFFSYLAKADTALSITLTALSSLVTVFTIPFIVNFGLDYFANEGVNVHLPVMETILRISLLTAFPLLLGMLLKRIAPVYCSKNESVFTVPLILIILFGLTMMISFISYQSPQVESIVSICFSVLLLNTVLLACGYCSGGLFKIKRKQKVTIGIESGIQNVVLAVTIAISPQFLNNSMFGITAGIYSVFMCTNCVIMIVWSRRLMGHNT